MNGSDRPGHRRLVLLFLASLLFAVVVVPAARSQRAEAAEAGEASASQVAEGLKLIQDIAADAATAAERDKAKATQISDGIEDVWKKIEDTVRGNEKDAYITFEDAFESLGSAAKAGDAKKAAKASDDVAVAVKAYVAKHPAEAAASEPAPAARAAEAAADPPARTAAAAADAPDATLARTGPSSAGALTALAGLTFALGGLAVIAGARRRFSPTV